MINLTVDKPSINSDALHAALKGALGDVYSGVSHSRNVAIVHLVDSATAQQQAQAKQLVEAHDPSVLTPEQQAARDRDAHPFFTKSVDELVALAESQDAVTFRREMARAFAYLRDAALGTPRR